MSTFAISFEKHASPIIKARIAADKAEGKHADTLNAGVNAFIDAARAAGIKPNEASCAALGAELKGCQAVVDAVAAGLYESKTWIEYARGAERAFFHGIPWTPSTFKKPELALPWSKPRGPKGPAKPATTAAPSAAPAPDMSTQSTEEIRAFIQGQARTLLAYLNKHLANADLQTRDVVQHFANAAAKLPVLPK